MREARRRKPPGVSKAMSLSRGVCFGRECKKRQRREMGEGETCGERQNYQEKKVNKCWK